MYDDKQDEYLGCSMKYNNYNFYVEFVIIIGTYFKECDFGKTVFLTKAEAEQKLKEMENK